MTTRARSSWQRFIELSARGSARSVGIQRLRDLWHWTESAIVDEQLVEGVARPIQVDRLDAPVLADDGQLGMRDEGPELHHTAKSPHDPKRRDREHVAPRVPEISALFCSAPQARE